MTALRPFPGNPDLPPGRPVIYTKYLNRHAETYFSTE